MLETTATTILLAASSALTETTGGLSNLNFSAMSPVEMALTLVLLLGALALRVWMKLNASKLSVEELKRGDIVARLATGAAEEIGAREKWTGPQKLLYARELVDTALPKASDAFKEALVHGALAVQNIGNIGASDIRKPDNQPDSPAK